MTQTWDTQAYAQNGAFVHGLAGAVIEWLAPQPGERILDLGCGDGQLTQRIAATGAIVTGVDASPSMVAAARARGLTVDEAPAELLPYANATFDAVFSNAALHWVRDQDAMMAQVHRVLKPGGRFVAEMGGQGNIAAIRVALMAVLARHGFGDREDGVNYYPTPDAYTRRLTRYGFTVERMDADSAPHSAARGRHERVASHFSPRRFGWIAARDTGCRCTRNGGAARAGTARRRR